MGTDHDRLTHTFEIEEKLLHLDSRTRIQSGIRFIENEKSRVVDKSTRHTQTLLHAAG